MFYVPPDQVEKAWSEGAHMLSEAVKKADGDMTAEHLKAELIAGRKTLLGHGGGWVVVEVQLYPGKRVLHVEAIWAPGVASLEVFSELAAFAKHNKCDAIQGACQPAVARLWKRKFGFKETYIVIRKSI